MDSFELNKIAGAVLFALLVGFGLSIASEMIFETEAPEAPGYMIAVAEPAEGEGGEAAAAAERPHIATLLASADPAAGEAAAKKCATCHTFGEGEANKVGPNLWNIVMRPIASHPGYEYSPAMVAYAAEAQVWDYDRLDAFLHSPPTTVPKTKMAFAGLKNDAERANIIAYLRSLAASPAPLPEAPAVEASAEAATATDAAEAPAQAATAEAPAEAATPAAPEAAAEGAAPAAEPATEVAAQDPATNTEAAPAEQGGGAADQPAQAAEGAAAAGQQVAAAPAEGAAASGGTAEVTQPAGTLGPIDSTTADQQGAVPQVAPIEQPAPEPAVSQADPQLPDAPAEAGAGQQVAQQDAPAGAAPQQGTAEQPAADAPAEGGAASGFAALVAAADPAKGQNVARRCAACHTFEKDGGNRLGPPLWDVVNRPVASVPDFEYSDAMVAFSEGGQKRWTFDELDPFLAAPQQHVPGTIMAFPGIKKDDERANLIAYLRTLSDNPAPLQ